MWGFFCDKTKPEAFNVLIAINTSWIFIQSLSVIQLVIIVIDVARHGQNTHELAFVFGCVKALRKIGSCIVAPSFDFRLCFLNCRYSCSCNGSQQQNFRLVTELVANMILVHVQACTAVINRSRMNSLWSRWQVIDLRHLRNRPNREAPDLFQPVISSSFSRSSAKYCGNEALCENAEPRVYHRMSTNTRASLWSWTMCSLWMVHCGRKTCLKHQEIALAVGTWNGWPGWLECSSPNRGRGNTAEDMGRSGRDARWFDRYRCYNESGSLHHDGSASRQCKLVFRYSSCQHHSSLLPMYVKKRAFLLRSSLLHCLHALFCEIVCACFNERASLDRVCAVLSDTNSSVFFCLWTSLCKRENIDSVYDSVTWKCCVSHW